MPAEPAVVESPAPPLVRLSNAPRWQEGPSQPLKVLDSNARVHLEARWAQSASDVRLAQLLRHRVFGAAQCADPCQLQGIAPDPYDDCCDHLLVVAPLPDRGRWSSQTQQTQELFETPPRRLVGTCRVMSPRNPLWPKLKAERSFDLASLVSLRSTATELSGCCLDPAYQAGGVSLLMAQQIWEYFRCHGLRWAIATVDVPISDGGHEAASLWRMLMQRHAAPTSLRIRPYLRAPWSRLQQGLPVGTPSLIQSLTRCGAKLLGEPAWDTRRSVAEFAWLLDMQHMPMRHATREPDA